MSNAEPDASTPHEFAALLGDPHRYLSLDDGTLAEFLHLSIQLYGTTCMEMLVEPVSTLYRRAGNRIPVATRRAIYEAAVAGIRKSRLSVSALLPFIFAERDRDIVSAAVLEYMMSCIYSPVVELYLSWLEKLNHPSTDKAFGAVAFGLINLIQSNSSAVVEELERDFGRRSGSDSTGIPRQQPLRSYILEVEPRMDALARAELAPKVMPLVLSAWRTASG